MKLYTLSRRTAVRAPIERVFEFFERPENLARLTPANLNFVILTPLPIAMQSGAVIDYEIDLFGISTHWRTLITDYEPPHRFVDIQLAGPYKYWHHSHRFIAEGDATIILDDVTYALPLGPLGRLLHAVLVHRRLNEIFDYRAEIIRGLFAPEINQGSDAAPEAA